ncbi:MAG TPA: exodeoxyribonuclease III [Candidatus Eisenbacteria bacterium]|jgi:exodeoxyribonuclease-3|nr:exodeoxyribonuclease III [Candidatus Eisenbacteria bacterium]
MKLISWNVNGIRSALRQGFAVFAEKSGADVLCVQETKAPGGDQKVDCALPEYPYHYWNNAARAGYSGTAIFSRVKPLAVTSGIGVKKHDEEGRVLTAEFKDFILVNVYVPNSKRALERLPYRTREWDVDFLKYLKQQEKKKPVVFCGDLNVAHKEIDLTNPKSNANSHGFTPEEREGFDRLVQAGFIDTFREFEKGGGHYTWWSPFASCRKRNIGWRIDYFLVSPALRGRLKEAFILPEVTGSDHCPVGITLK